MPLPLQLDVPDNWPRPDDELVTSALAIARESFGDDTARPAVDRLTAYYDPAGKYSGVTFLELARSTRRWSPPRTCTR